MKIFRPQPFLTQILDLTLIQLSNWRWTWRGTLITGMLAPAVSIAAMGALAAGGDRQVFSFVLTGNLVLALMFENQGKVCSNFSFMKAVGTLNYFASLPISRQALILATILAFFLMSLPALLVTMLFGSIFLHLPLHVHPLLLAALPLIATPLAAIGAMIGLKVRRPEEAGAIINALTFLLLGLGPVVIPPSRLPEMMMIAGWFSPTSYAASALRQLLLGPVTWRLALDLSVLAALSALLLYWVGRSLAWRREAA